MSEAVYAYYPVFRRIRGSREIGLDDVAELERVLANAPGEVTVRGTYSGVGFRPDAELLFWWVTPTPDAAQHLLVEVRHTAIGRTLELTHAFMGVTRPAEFNPEHRPAFLRGEPARRYLSVYPFVRTEDWYLLPSEERSKLLREHGEMGREFPDVLPNTTSAFGIGDWEWILAFESDDLTRIVDCIRRLRDAEARRYTKLDVPFVVGIRKNLPDALRDLS